MKLKKLIGITFIVLTGLTSAFAKEAYFDGEDYNIEVMYEEEVSPSDAFFVRMTVTSKKKIKTEQVKATAELFGEKKRLDKSNFYFLGQKKKSTSMIELLTGIPVSTWTSAQDGKIVVTYTLDDSGEKSFELPVKITKREFDHYTIEMNEQMTNVSTTTNPKKVEQSKRLNEVICSIDPNGVYDLEGFIQPVKSTRITSPYGQRRVYVYPSGKKTTGLHTGKDFGVPTGTEVYAVAGGKVHIAENRILTGFTVVIEHLPGLYTMYYHNSELKVNEGDIVKQGDVIALSGATGFATGPHCHWEARLNTLPLDPDFFTRNYTFKTLSK